MITHGRNTISQVGYSRRASEGGGAVAVTNIIRGAQTVFGGLAPNVDMWLKGVTKAAILAAFGQTDGKAVIKATNRYLNVLALTDEPKAKALAQFIDEAPVLIGQFWAYDELKAVPDAGLLNIKSLQDGSVWVQILHHHVKNGTQMYPNRNAAGYNINSELFSILKHIANFYKDSKYEFLAEEYYTEGGALSIQRRWSQTSNPYTSTSLTGFTNISNGIGIYKYNGNECPIITLGNWWGATGSLQALQGGIPGYNGSSINKGTLDLWIRVA